MVIIMNKKYRLLAAVMLLLSCAAAQAAEDGVLSFLSDLNRSKESLGYAVASGFRSQHMSTRVDYNENNRGVGIRIPGGWTTGGYYNSIRRYSVYAGREYQWRLLGPDWLQVRAGGVVGVVSGYEDGIRTGGVKHGIHLMALPELVLAGPHVELAMLYIPSATKTPATLAAQLRITF